MPERRTLTVGGKLLVMFVAGQVGVFWVTTIGCMELLKRHDLLNEVTSRLVLILFPLIQMVLAFALMSSTEIGRRGERFLIPGLMWGAFLMALLNPSWIGGWKTAILVPQFYFLLLSGLTIRCCP